MLQEVFYWIFNMSITAAVTGVFIMLVRLVKKIPRRLVVFLWAIPFLRMNSVRAADSYFPVTYKVNILEKVFGVASVIWIIVFLAIFLMLMVIYFTTLHEMKDATHLRNNIYLSDKSISPVVYGIIKPRIVLPVYYKDKDIELIILHEKIHICRADNLWRMLAFLIVAAHWFNPLCWVFLKLFLDSIHCIDSHNFLYVAYKCRMKGA